MDLKGRVAVITGATGALGSTVARELAAQGTPLALLGRNDARLKALVKSLSLPKTRLFSECVDLLNPLEMNSVANAITTRFGRMDILLHLVGGWTGGKSLFAAQSDELALMLNQHIWTSFHVTQAFVPYLVKNGWGRVIMVTSPSASRPNARGGPYAIGKAGQEALLLTLSQELKGTGVTANLLQVKTIDAKQEKVSAPTSENATWTTTEELTAAILYLLSDEAGTINGAKIPLFGSF